MQRGFWTVDVTLRGNKSGKKKAHKHKLFGPVALGTTPGMSRGQTGFNVPGTKWVCPREKPRFSPHFTQWKPSLSQGQTQFVPGTIPGTKGGRKSLYVKRFLLPNKGAQKIR